MSNPDLHHQLKTITSNLLTPDVNYNAIRMAVHELKDLFYKAVDFDEAEAAKQQHIQTAGGQAINIYTAALIITDMMRTRKFLMGIKEAVDVRLKTNPGKPVTVFYAGSGPFATLLTPLTTIFSPDQLQMILLEINPASIHYLEKTIQQFGLEKYIAGVEEADAVLYSIPGKYQPDILLSETMRPSLQKEPQVSIVANLLPQCKNKPILIPESIMVEACLMGYQGIDAPSLKSLHILLNLDSSSAVEIKKEPVISTGIVIHIPEKPEPLYTSLALTTTVKVFGDHIIGAQESGLTMIRPEMDLAAIPGYPASFLIRYIMNENPGFEMKIL